MPLSCRARGSASGRTTDHSLSERTLHHTCLQFWGEALSNASRHANATNVSLTVQVSDVLRLVVSDNGGGMPAAVQGSGLRNIRERAQMLGGSFTVESTHGAGTTLSWTVPLH